MITTANPKTSMMIVSRVLIFTVPRPPGLPPAAGYCHRMGMALAIRIAPRLQFTTLK